MCSSPWTRAGSGAPIEAGLLAPVQSEVLAERVPEALRHPDGHWFGVSTRARVIFYDKDKISEPPQTYAAIWPIRNTRAMVCARSSSNIYMLSLLASQIAHNGEDAAKAWAQGLKDNLAREPQGGDTDQLQAASPRANAASRCRTPITSSARSPAAVDGLSDAVDRIGIVFPDQGGNGTHVNISGAAVTTHAPHRDNAVKFIEYLTSDSAQGYFANGNNEYPVVAGVEANSAVEASGRASRPMTLNLSALGENQARAQEIYNEVGYK
jgi:iron(III) transport system substrate-binding protein